MRWTIARPNPQLPDQVRTCGFVVTSMVRKTHLALATVADPFQGSSAMLVLPRLKGWKKTVTGFRRIRRHVHRQWDIRAGADDG